MIIKTENGRTITIVGDMDAEQALEAHGYDPNNVDYTVQE